MKNSTTRKKRVVIVVPTIRKQSVIRFLDEWKNEFFNNNKYIVHLIIVEDNPKKTFNITKYIKSLTHYAWEDIEKSLGKKSWIIPRRTDCIRSFGYYKAYKMSPDMIITLDDDCYPLQHYLPKIKSNLIEMHWNALNKRELIEENAWLSTIKNLRPRGMPYKSNTRFIKKNIILNHGLWYNVPDFDGITQLKAKKTKGLKGYAIKQIIPKDKYFPMCGMNIAWKKEATPAMYFLLMGQNKKSVHWGFDRYGDIWCGIFFKKIVNHLGYQISSGDPIIWHDRASDPFANIKKEKMGIKVNEYLWKKVDDIQLTKQSFKSCYIELSNKLSLSNNYWDDLKKAMKIWAKLY